MRIRFLNAIFIAIFVMPIAAGASAPLCSDLFTSTTDYIVRIQELLEPDNQEPLAEVISQPQDIEFLNGPVITRSNVAWSVPAALRDVIPKAWSPEYNNSSVIQQTAFLENLFKAYGSAFSKEAKDDILKADRSLELENTTYGEVRTRTATIGTWRWFEANPITDGLPRRKELHYERMNRHQNVGELEITKKLEHFMDLGVGVTEIGNFVVRSGDPAIRARATRLIEMAWLRLARNDEIYICHVLTPAHERLYRKYGFEVAEAYDVPGKKTKDAILWVRGWQFKAALKKYLQVELTQASSSGKPKMQLLPAEFSANP
jgi:hypothetical protein